MTFEERNNEILQQNVAKFNTNLRRLFKKFDEFGEKLGLDTQINSITMNENGKFFINFDRDLVEKNIQVSTNLVKQFFNECFGTNKRVSTQDLLEIREMYLKISNHNDGIVVIDEDGTLCSFDKDLSNCHFVEDIYKHSDERYKQYLKLKKEFEQTL